MIKRLKTTLQMAALEDMLQHDMGLTAGEASWLARMAWDSARQNDLPLYAVGYEGLKHQFFRLMALSRQATVLKQVAADSPRFAAELAKSAERERRFSDLAAA